MKRVKFKRPSKLFCILMSILLVIACAIIAIPNDIWRPAYSDTGLQIDTANGAYLHYLDVGQGDCTAIASKDELALIDVGNTEEGDTVVDKLTALGHSKIDLILITHAHYDHIGGLRAILSQMNVGSVLIPKWEPDSKSDRNFLNAVKSDCKKYGVTLATLNEGDSFSIGRFDLKVLFINEDAEEENDRSAIIKATAAGSNFLFTGDATSETEKLMVKKGLNLDCEVLKAGHHGSRYSTTDELLSAARPGLVIFSCGAGNSYGHPSSDTLNRLRKRGIDWFRTDINGDITVDAAALRVAAERGEVTLGEAA